MHKEKTEYTTNCAECRSIKIERLQSERYLGSRYLTDASKEQVQCMMRDD